jgi:surfeit locus 1 family protein
MSSVRALTSPPMLLLHLLGVLAVGIAGAMGWWQLSAWQEQREDRALQLVDEEPRALADVLGPDDPFPGAHVGRPVQVDGVWLPESAFFVTDRRRTAEGADDGVWQVALLASCPGGGCETASAIPVVLGWAPSTEEGVPAPSGRASVSGWLQPAEQSGADERLGDDVLPALRTALLLQLTERDVYSGFVILDRPDALRDALVPVTPASLPDPPPSTALRNLLYGLEWWLFAGFAIYLWWRWSRDAVADARRQEQEQPVTSSA